MGRNARNLGPSVQTLKICIFAPSLPWQSIYYRSLIYWKVNAIYFQVPTNIRDLCEFSTRWLKITFKSFGLLELKRGLLVVTHAEKVRWYWFFQGAQCRPACHLYAFKISGVWVQWRTAISITKNWVISLWLSLSLVYHPWWRSFQSILSILTTHAYQ